MKARSKVSSIRIFLLASVACASNAFAGIAYVQSNAAVPQTPQTTVSITYNAAQTAGDLNVVLIGWYDTTSHVLSVTDTRGNAYTAALAPTTQSVAGTHVIYYAPNVAASSAGTNTVTVTFDAAVQYPDIRIAEYSGVATSSPVDVAVGAGGSSATASSGSVTTTNANDLLVAGNFVSSHTDAAGTGFTSRLITDPDGSILEDRIVSATGSYSATASLPSAPWVMQMVAFKAASTGGGDTTPPTAPTNLAATAASTTQVNLTWSASTDNVAVTNYLIERCAGAGCSNFAQIATSATTSYSNTGLTASTSYSYRVRATDAANNLSSYSSTATASTPAAADTQAPTAPTGLSATAASATQVNLTWTASTDNVGVTNYLIERCAGAGCSNFAQIATSATNSYSNTGLTASTSYSYRVRATDAANNLSAYSSTSTVSTPAAADTQAPTAPGNLATAVISSAQINLTWTASTDNVGVTNYLIERCAGAGCSNFAQIATSATNSYSNTGLTASTSYSYRVRATDAASNLSAYSSTATASTPAAADTQAPTAPTGLGATAASSTQVNLTWTASTDNVGVTNYLIERCAGAGCSNFAQIATSATTSYSNTGLTASTSYSYRVRATDAANNLSAYSSTKSVTTPGAADTQAPTAPTNLATAVISSTQINLTWTASTDNVGVTNYLIERCAGAGCSNFAQIATSATASYNNTGLTASTSYSYRVRATDAASNLSTYSATATATTQAGGGGTSTPTYIQSNYAVPQTPQTTVSVTYTAAQTTGNLNVILIGWYDTTSHVISVTDSTGNSYVVGAAPVTQAVAGTHVIYYAPNIGAAGANSNKVTVTFDAAVQYPDIRIAEYSGVATSNPVDVAVSGSGNSATSSSGAVTTTNATDLLVAGNFVSSSTTGPGAGFFSRVITNPNGSILEDRTTTTAGSYTATAPISSAPWVMQMVAFRAASTGGPDATPPTAPSSLAATAVSGTQINLTWTASTDNVGVTSYLIERCAGAGCSNFAQIGTSATAAYADSGLTAATSYSYRVRATDAANNLSAYSGTATAATPAPDTQAPTAPSNLSATTISSSQVNLTWAASTDNVGVTSYRVERCMGAGCSTFAQIGTSVSTSYSDSTLSASTTYSYRVRASDAASNLSGYSGVASATTQAGGALNNLGFVQNASQVPQSNQTSVTATFGLTQTAANLNVVIIGWFDSTSNITSVTDTAGNEYTLASGPTTHPTAGTQAIYYAANIKAAAPGNAITVRFTAAVPYPDLKIAEYTGVDPNNPLDTGAEATGTSQIPNSGLFVTSHAYDLIVAGNYVTSKTTSAGPGFVNRVITIPDGSILEDRIVTSAGSYSAQANMDPGSWIMQAVAFRGGAGPAVDNVPPTVSVTGPAPLATVSGTVAFTANAADTGGSGLGGVQFQVDGINVGPAITTTPFSTNFNTAQFANGTHTITAYAWDGSRNLTTSSAITVTFSNASPGNPAVTGWWSGTFPWPLVAIHLNQMSDGRFMAWDQFATGNPVPQIWDPVTSQFTPVQTNDSDNLFCSGHNTLPDGRLFVAGGEVFTGTGITNSHTGLTSAHIFDPVTNLWSSAASMAYGRWYPTQTTMSDGKVFTIAGEINCFNCDATIPEIYDPKTNTWTQITQASLDIPWYPYTFLLPDGRLIVTGTAESPTVTRAYDPVAKSWTTIDNRTLGGGSSAMYLPGKFIKSGTPASTLDPATASANTTYMLDMTAANPSWQTVAPMAFPRTYHVMTTLPDGSVLATGGGRTTGFADIANAVYQAEIWSPTTQTWTTMASMSAPRLYHQTAILLADGRVLVSGSGRGYGRADATDQLSGEIYSPPYLFKGPRPVITSAPASLTVGQNFTVQTPNAANIASVVLIRVGSVTHTFNMDQRYVPLTFTAGSGSLTVNAPANSNLAPPGSYMLFLVDSNGVPSVSKIVRF